MGKQTQKAAQPRTQAGKARLRRETLQSCAPVTRDGITFFRTAQGGETMSVDSKQFAPRG